MSEGETFGKSATCRISEKGETGETSEKGKIRKRNIGSALTETRDFVVACRASRTFLACLAHPIV